MSVYSTSLLLAPFAMAIASFLNVCISRIPDAKTNLWYRSRCPHCGASIPWYDNIPILSFYILKRKCRYCKSHISWQYPVVEILGTFLILFTLGRFHFSFFSFFAAAMLSLLLVISFIDMQNYIVPNVLVLAGLVIAALKILLTRDISISSSILGLLGGGSFLLVAGIFGQIIFKKESMGAGDVKLAAMLGAFVGLKGILMSLFLAIFIAAFTGAMGILLQKLDRKSILPFGPFIAFATTLYILFPHQIEFYFYLFYG
ncbi:MAG: prepilin peptidase [Calditrichaeota bacterium]|nr:prepilin peptidase [Calditrichota bacterium]